LAPNGALPERFVSACALHLLRALSHIHKEGIVHANLDMDHVLVYLTPFGGDHFRLHDFDNARQVGSEIHPVF